jgi:hypothetical protein
MATMYENNLCANSVGRIEYDISLTVHSSAILKSRQLNAQWYKKNQMHAYEMSLKCQLYPTHTVAT